MCFMSHFSFRSILYLGAILYFVTPDLQREVNGFRGPTLIWSLCIRATFTSTISQLHDSFSTSIFSLRYCLKGGDYLTITFLPRRDKKRIRGLDFEGFPLILGVPLIFNFTTSRFSSPICHLIHFDFNSSCSCLFYTERLQFSSCRDTAFLLTKYSVSYPCCYQINCGACMVAYW